MVTDKDIPKQEDEVREHDWPSKNSLEDYACPSGIKSRGSIRIAAGLTTDRVTIRARWKQVTAALRKML